MYTKHDFYNFLKLEKNYIFVFKILLCVNLIVKIKYFIIQSYKIVENISLFFYLGNTVLIHLSGLHLSGRSLIQTVSFKKKIQKILNIKHYFCLIQVFKLSCCKNF